MTKTETSFLNMLRAVVHEEKPADPDLTGEEWTALLRLAEAHKLMPLILDAACVLPSCRIALAPAPRGNQQNPSPARHSERSEAESKNPSPTRHSERSEESASPAAAHSVRQEERIATAGARTGFAMTETRHSERSEAESKNPSPARDVVPSASPNWKELALEQAARQAIQENEFLNLILFLQQRGLTPVVMKGPVCRALYPKPLLRSSVDDDLLIPDEQTAAYHAALLESGMTADDPDADLEKAWELSYHKPASPLYIELHKRLFDPDSPVFENFNAFFDGALDRAEPIRIQDVELLTLAPTDHLLFLLLHAFKHFLHSGFGLRIVADICLYTWHYGERIDFARIREACDTLRAAEFVAAVYRIGEKYLDLPIPEVFAAIEADESELLEDVLASGLHGAEIDRLHSANITLGAVADENRGKTRSGGLVKTLFPSAKKLSGRYPYLEKKPWLLPAAWTSRVATYLKERGKYGKQSPAASLRIGKERVKLLESYGVIDSEP